MIIRSKAELTFALVMLGLCCLWFWDAYTNGHKGFISTYLAPFIVTVNFGTALSQVWRYTHLNQRAR